ncbi:rRNA maturation RNase YbeY [Virgibacillus dakarensis]|uniref:Endoribonuclease YbeY n=1 Tax=Lentibacillus populi TaxID=1827502 RepID=A0A9W5X3Q5_9BACI|nr:MULTISPECIES: rRNA maturation RNase YbeY [Bacillaceae]MBT2214498.1 rRNA maturation RNase YbeY [Virgibacillus dakarensis]MTW84103.1 rRNA maturation RNase YbeY [Virgibacillus dakarensis]GGB29084.1 endoribonuclease YbeY [Lentibacillus populi]
MHIDFHDQTNSVPSDFIDMLHRLLDFAAEKEGITNEAEVSVNFVDNKKIQELNRNYRQQNRPTDVISFALQETVDGELQVIGEDIPLVLGDIVISVDRAKEQAADYNHSLEREIGFLSVHGFLHLLGYDHVEKEEEEEMFQRQEDILDAFGLKR